MEEAFALGIEGVPFMFVNDQEILGQASESSIIELIEFELKENLSIIE